MNRLLGLVAAIRQFCEIFALLLFLLFWPAANLYWVVCGMFGLIGITFGIDSTVGGIFGAASFLMAFLVPLWSIVVMGAYYFASALAVVSLRLIPMLLLLVAWLEMENFIPSGHILLRDVPTFGTGEINWLHPILYSVLAILGIIQVVLRVRRTSGSFASTKLKAATPPVFPT